MEKVYLTKLAPNCGCAAKVGPGTLAGVLCKLPQFHDEHLLVGTETSDDAAVYKISDELAMIQTLDFFTPVADDPYDFGQIAAANALSDVYAMGGEPKTALNIVAFPKEMDTEILGEIREFYTTFQGWDTMLHTLNGFLCAAIGFSLVDLFNRNERFSLSLSPAFMAIVAFCFSMTIGVLWEFFECTMDQLFFLDMQKDTIVNTIGSVMLDPTGGQTPRVIRGITDVILVTDQGNIPLGLGGYLDIGLLDTMKDLAVNFVGAVVFSIIGYFYVKSRGKGRFARRFIPRVEETGVKTEKQQPTKE